ncbi:cupin domain-containing protein [Rhodohalobacter mucosus]|uniref:Cupin domain-containing protein n=1 Tax=Rhodohalobacter mucosus TaxID=2079485 RepID=A0A316TLB5_9BACT|nr:cupin domain-containing protein [Rhodohalobacter mucosus]PWN05357.1 cupin domain-containing protein [Rhodohalobacter mucosus]
MKNRSRIIKADGFTWKGVERKEYKTGTSNFKGVHRYSLLGDETEELNFHSRYFEIRDGGYSSLEQHRHPHSVVIIRGSGSLILDNEIHHLALHDVIFISPDTIHQFHADKGEPLGFLCMVDRYRDKPVIPDDDAIQNRITDRKVLQKIRK